MGIKESNDYQFKGVWIPREIWEADDITWMEKCLLAEINALDNGIKGCNASNDYLASKFSSSAASIANQISKLRGLGYLETVSFDGRERRMHVRGDLIRRLRQESLAGLLRVHSEVEALIQEKKGDRKEEEFPLTPKGDGAAPAKKMVDFSDGFEAFYQAYPNKQKKTKALEAWKRKRCALIIEEIMLAVAIQKTSFKWTKQDGRFIPLPTTWINAGEWQNEVKETEATTKPKRESW